MTLGTLCVCCMRWGAHPQPKCNHDNTMQCASCNLAVGYPKHGQKQTDVCIRCYEAEHGKIP